MIVPLFIPNQGCPHRCIFCRQEKITGQSYRPIDGSTVRETLERATGSPGFMAGRAREIAFYGGTFTNLSIEKITELLEAADPFLKKGHFESIRVSTRPDSMDKNRLELMRHYGVNTVELGVQSMNDRVLELSGRGHSAKDTVKSVHLLKELGFNVGIQLMPGLPGDSEETFRETVKEVVVLGPKMVRLYPALVIRGTGLERLFRDGHYTPLGLEEAVKLCSESCILLESEGIPVIRIGLMSSPALLEEGQIVAGPWHQAFGFLVRSEIRHRQIEANLPKRGEAGAIRLRVPSREIPLVRGYKNRGIRAIEKKTGAAVRGVLGDDAVPAGQVEIDRLA